MAGVDFILNTIQNRQKEITELVAGDMDQARLAGVRTSRRVAEVGAPCAAEIVVASPGGFPRDLDLHRSRKAMAAAEMVVADGETIMLPAECSDGVGGSGFCEWMSATATPQDVIGRFFREGFSIGSSKAWLYERCLVRADVILASRHIEDHILQEMLTKRADSVDDALEMALAKHGHEAKVLVLRNSEDLIPRVGSSGDLELGRSTVQD